MLQIAPEHPAGPVIAAVALVAVATGAACLLLLLASRVFCDRPRKGV